MISSLMGRERTLQARGIFLQVGMYPIQTSLYIIADSGFTDYQAELAHNSRPDLQARGESRDPVGHTSRETHPARGNQEKK